ncbi:YggT family protein [Paraconexibacter algicola]|uniref:Cell division protein ZapA n=1 Tax=Paraconexibacter algicola TaxID=2133960 RepID=A0A2T4UBE6_9ACTN|nr:YggT family protein [Paraconexibacter algicola]PTL54194.1 cell division protein ZapA [Paraconexibacter algicola]
MTATFVLATIQEEIGGFIRTLTYVYVLLIIAYILTQLFFGFGGRMPYNRTGSAILGFLNDTVGPYLNLFRRFIPPLGPLDLSPIVAIFVLQIAGNLLAGIVEHA